MNRTHAFVLPLLALSLLLVAPAHAGKKKEAAPKNPVVEMKTTLGDVKLELFQDKAPISVENFLKYVDEKAYDGTIFHRVIDGFMIQGGGMDEHLVPKTTHAPIKNEASNGLKNKRGTLAMARTSVPDSANMQFFINVVDNAFLDFRDESPSGIGYAVFGQVVSGLDVVDKIKAVPTAPRMGTPNVPVQTVQITSIRRVDK